MKTDNGLIVEANCKSGCEYSKMYYELKKEFNELNAEMDKLADICASQNNSNRELIKELDKLKENKGAVMTALIQLLI